MPRPRSILWVDDEIESLTSHVMFLEEQGFSVDTSAHGDDALVMLQRQPYGVVLLDEQMPGRRGLELFRAIRSMDQSMPVVMVTKSEEPETFKDALGAEISDYLVKPVNPRQILTVITRLLEGDRIRQQRLSRDFASRFRELEARRGAALGWREWIEFVVELAEWEVRLGQADEPGLQDALRTLQESLRQDFAKFLQRSYAGWLRDGRSDRPPLSVDIGAEFLRPALQSYGKALLVVVDCLRLDQWAMIRPLIGELFDIETSHYFSILPTATPYARNAIFSGLFPSEIKQRYPKWWADQDENSLNAHEGQLLVEQLKDICGTAGAGALREGLQRPGWRGTAAPAARAPAAARGHGAGLQLHRPAHARPLGELHALRGGTGHPRPPRAHARPGSSAHRCSMPCAKPNVAACRCCSPPTTAAFTATRRPPSSPSATPPATCATSSARTCAPRTTKPPSWSTTC